jgi:hypothetical protein
MSIVVTWAVIAAFPQAIFDCCDFIDRKNGVLSLAGKLVAASLTPADTYSISGAWVCLLKTQLYQIVVVRILFSVTKTMDLCELAISSYLQLIPEPVNIFVAPCKLLLNSSFDTISIDY